MASRHKAQKTVLPSGVRVLSEKVNHVDSASIGIWVGAGARHEGVRNYGVSHFIEHMLFKGTERRSAQQIADEMDSIGAHLNAFTDKEYTCYYARTLAEHLDVALDVLSDMVLRSVFDPEEIVREQNVVLEEIKRHEDTPDDLVHDMFAQLLWRNHPLGNPVIGSRKTVEGLTRDLVLSYMSAEYTPDNMLISVAGNVEHRALVELVEEKFSSLSGRKASRVSSKIEPVKEMNLVEKSTEQVHFCIGSEGYPQRSKQKYTLAVADSVLGGGMSSRLFQEIREKRGLVYTIGSYCASYADAGLFVVFGGTSTENFEKVNSLVREGFAEMLKRPITEAELERAKNQIRGALVLGQESMSNRMSRMAKSEFYLGRIIRLREIIEEIMSVSREDVSRVAGELFTDGRFAMAAIGPIGSMEDMRQ